MQLSNEGLTTEIGSYTEHLSPRANRSAIESIGPDESKPILSSVILLLRFLNANGGLSHWPP
jgi:hypothetical protein